jgi:RNase P protein component
MKNHDKESLQIYLDHTFSPRLGFSVLTNAAILKFDGAVLRDDIKRFIKYNNAMNSNNIIIVLLMITFSLFLI